jgi:dTDP-glucose 4,6-dehydratase
MTKTILVTGVTKCQKFNIVSDTEINNLELAQFIADVQNKPLNYKMADFHSSHPGHDLQYALDGSKMKNMRWLPTCAYKNLEQVINWTLKNNSWLIT